MYFLAFSMLLGVKLAGATAKLFSFDARSGSETRRLQSGIEQALRELIDAVKKKQEENQNGQDSGGQGGQDEPAQEGLAGGGAAEGREGIGVGRVVTP